MSALDADCDVAIVGSGPAGVSAAFPLVDAGLRVTMIDGGEMPDVAVPAGEYLDVRARDAKQIEWFAGRDPARFVRRDAISPKFRERGRFRSTHDPAARRV